MDQVTVPRELLRRAYAEILHLSRMANVDHTERSIIGELRTALEQPAVEPDSVAVHQVKLDSDGYWKDIAEHELSNYPASAYWETRTLYTAPQAQPRKAAVKLTDAEIDALWVEGEDELDHRVFTRTIEQAVLKRTE